MLTSHLSSRLHPILLLFLRRLPFPLHIVHCGTDWHPNFKALEGVAACNFGLLTDTFVQPLEHLSVQLKHLMAAHMFLYPTSTISVLFCKPASNCGTFLWLSMIMRPKSASWRTVSKDHCTTCQSGLEALPLMHVKQEIFPAWSHHPVTTYVSYLLHWPSALSLRSNMHSALGLRWGSLGVQQLPHLILLTNIHKRCSWQSMRLQRQPHAQVPNQGSWFSPCRATAPNSFTGTYSNSLCSMVSDGSVRCNSVSHSRATPPHCLPAPATPWLCGAQEIIKHSSTHPMILPNPTTTSMLIEAASTKRKLQVSLFWPYWKMAV